MIVTLDSKRRLTIPAALAETAPCDAFDALYDEEEDEIILRRVKGNDDWLEIMKQCPVPMDDLPPPRYDEDEDEKSNWLDVWKQCPVPMDELPLRNGTPLKTRKQA